jgi:hypothetical protein
MEGPRYLRPMYVRDACAAEKSGGQPMIARLCLVALALVALLATAVYLFFQIVLAVRQFPGG